jgi:aminoglycoside phosphotransferase (APT) family kinase protein
VAKLPLADAGDSAYLARRRADPAAWRAWVAKCSREIRFYRDLAKGLPVPHCLFAFGDEGGMLVLLEDLTGATPGDALLGGDPDLVAATLRATARIHGRFATSAGELDLSPALARDPDAAAERGRRDLPRFLARFGDRIPSPVRRLLEPLIFDSGRLFRDLPGTADTLVHADLHLDNVFFRHDEALLLDWQSFGRGPGPLEAARFLATELRAEDRPAEDRRLFDLYADELATAGGPGLGAKERERWRVRGLLQALWSSAVWMGSVDRSRYTGREGAFVTLLVDDPALLRVLEAEGGPDLLDRL